MKLTEADKVAVLQQNADYLLNKGAKLYTDGTYPEAVEYFRLAAAMGSVQAVSNLGYCYMYGRSIPKDTDLAMAYFQSAAERGSIDATYKLGDIYRKGNLGADADPELAAYYLARAARLLAESGENPVRYANLMLAVAEELIPGGNLPTDIGEAWECLEYAQEGFLQEIENGVTFHDDYLARTEELMELPIFKDYQGTD